MSVNALVNEHNRLMALNMKCVGGGAWIPVCCNDQHEACVFTSGSLYCIQDPCGNPHHGRKGT